MKNAAPACVFLFFLMVLFVAPLRADIPVIDNTNLDRHSQTQSHTNKTKDTQTSTLGNTKGIDCSVHQGSKYGAAKDSTANPDQAGADKALRQYGGDPLTMGGGIGEADGVARGQTGAVAGQQDASSQDAIEGENTLQGLSGQIGQSETIKGAFDQNSILAIQNGMELNSVIRTANAWVQAINTMNMMSVSQQSSGATVMTPPASPHCVAGTSGQGTASQPCRTKSCDTVEISQSAQPDCIEVKYHDSYNNVVTYLLTVEDAANFKTMGLVLN